MLFWFLLGFVLYGGGCSCEGNHARRLYLTCIEESHGRKECEPLLRGLSDPPPEAQDVVLRATEGR
jgi:hypothetical protein